MSYPATSVLADPGFRRERARKAAAARTSPDYHIDKLTAAAASLTDEQRARLRPLVVRPRRTAENAR